MKKILFGLFAVFLAAQAGAVEINDLRAVAPPTKPHEALGIPGFIWWAMAVFAVSGVVAYLTRFSRWLHDRLCEPSTHVALAVFLSATGLFINSLSLDPMPSGQGLLLSSAVFAFLGLIGKDGKGPLL